MNKTHDSIEVSKTTLFDCRKVFYNSILIGGVGCGLYAIISHLYFGCLVVFIVFGLLNPGFYINLRTPYRFEFKDDSVRVCFRFYGKKRVETIPYDCFVFVKKNWHQKGNQNYSVNYWDNRKKNFYSFCMPTLTTMNHWDEEALNYLLTLAEQNGVTIKNWDYPIRWGR